MRQIGESPAEHVDGGSPALPVACSRYPPNGESCHYRLIIATDGRACASRSLALCWLRRLPKENCSKRSRHWPPRSGGTPSPAPTFSSALAYYDSYRSARLPANLLQGQRDYFGAHTYQRVDQPGAFHTLWAEPGREEIEA